MKVLLTGATGFTGRRVARELESAGHRLRCFVRESSDRTPLDGLDTEFVVGDLGDPAGLARALEGSDALLNVASLGFGHGPGIVAACEEAGVRRAVFFSTTAIFTSLPAPSRAARLGAEDAIRDSGLLWTILRPTMIYGAPGDRNVERLLRVVVKLPALPVVGGGHRMIQPVLVDDLARFAVRALETDRTIRRTYSMPGRAPLRFRDFVREAAKAAGTSLRLVSLPERLAVAAARAYERVVAKPRVRAEQVLRLLEDKDFLWIDAARDFGYDPTPAGEGLRIEVRRLGLGGAS